MVTVYYNNERLEIFEETFNSLKEAKNFIESLAEENVHNAHTFVHAGKHDWTAHYAYEVHWTTGKKEFSISFETESMAKAFYNQMCLIYQDDWYSLYLFEHLGQGLLKQLSYACKV
jgi:hypothetical protein